MLGPKAPGIDLAIGQGRLILTPQVRAKEQPMPRLDAYFSSSALPRSPTFSLSPAISAAPTYQWWKSVTVPFETAESPRATSSCSVKMSSPPTPSHRKAQRSRWRARTYIEHQIFVPTIGSPTKDE